MVVLWRCIQLTGCMVGLWLHCEIKVTCHCSIQLVFTLPASIHTPLTQAPRPSQLFHGLLCHNLRLSGPALSMKCPIRLLHFCLQSCACVLTCLFEARDHFDVASGLELYDCPIRSLQLGGSCPCHTDYIDISTFTTISVYCVLNYCSKARSG